ncbi:RNA-directed DNA polymerase from mobile element jockey [Araneus ventricosus]|uniref:RNA-directed DNA polymerase from mobile element jockey n=1 Tax=Araneus ventricosus TaxID=182803 RepID=A0A4Y2X082_ARAVE|nr:RNA-directed DNA polymerase from mobile element jockey [Araneus ventricosus]
MLQFNYFPNVWKSAIVVPILKPGKSPYDPGSYRPISLLSALSKIAESVILKRIVEATEGKLIPFQFGFPKQLSTVQQLLRLTETVKEGMDEGWDTGAVFLDIAKAFDRVWTDGLLYRKVPDPPKLYRRAIHWRKDTKYLGITLDSRLTYEKHINNIFKQTRSVKARLYPLLGRNSKLSLQNKLLLYKTILRPKMTYASPVWGAAAHSHIQKLEATQNITARQIINAQWFIRNRYILKDLRLPPVLSHVKDLAKKFFHGIDNHTNQAIQEIPTYDPSNPGKKKRPRTLLLPGN